uniref:Uncharacterized protein At3g61260 n=1 Tax=Anthurium amnicola TaxID=1678845 RepID=A0A1D1Y5R1_9ARAE
MEYERIQKPNPQGGGGGGISPSKLRLMLLGVEKRRKEEEDLESRCSLRFEAPDVHDRYVAGASSSETCKDVDVVCSLPECSTVPTEMATGHQRPKDIALATMRAFKVQEDDSIVAYNSVMSTTFEFQKADRAQQQRPALVPLYSKPAPSKWDDAQKWIASPTSNRTGKSGGVLSKKMVGGILGYGNRQCATKVLEVTEEVDTKGIDLGQMKKEAAGQRSVSWVPDPYPVADTYVKPTLDNLVVDSAVCLSQHDSSTVVHSSTTFINPAPTVRSVSMRDMGTEMTPITSQEPSRTGTPVRSATPILSPTSSRPSTPGRAAPISSPVDPVDHKEHSSITGLTHKELQMKTRKEIMVLGTQLGKLNIAAWARTEEEDKDASVSLEAVPVDQPAKSVIHIRAAAWEEAEKAKYLARFKREEIKIQAWENHQKAKTEAEMRKIEVEVERMRAHAQDRLMNKLAVARHKAEEKRAAAEAKRYQQAARTAQQVEYIRRTGRIPPSFSCWNWCR